MWTVAAPELSLLMINPGFSSGPTDFATSFLLPWLLQVPVCVDRLRELKLAAVVPLHRLTVTTANFAVLGAAGPHMQG
jgi:hypothetical protein